MAENEKETDNKNIGPAFTPDGTPVVRTIGRDFRVEGNDVDGYVGVTAEYRTYANEADKPYVTQDEVDVYERTGYMTDVEAMTVQVAGVKKNEADAEDEDEAVGAVATDDSDKTESVGDKAAKEGQGATPKAGISAPTKVGSTKEAAPCAAPDKK